MRLDFLSVESHCVQSSFAVSTKSFKVLAAIERLLDRRKPQKPSIRVIREVEKGHGDEAVENVTEFTE